MNILTLFCRLNQNLQKEILRQISSQPKNLLNDIINYHQTKNQINIKYYQHFIVDKDEGILEDKYWLLNDLYIYTDDLNGFWERFLKEINIPFFGQRLITSQINTIWGIMTPKERNDFIEKTIC